MKDKLPSHISQKRLVRMFKDIKRLQTEENRFCFLIGAGASRSSGIKTGWELSEQWHGEIKNDLEEDEFIKWRDEIGLTLENVGAFYPYLYQKRYEVSPQVGYEEFKKLMEDIEPSIGYVILSQILAKEKHNFVITTNFDYLIEDSVRLYTATKPFTAGHETLAEFISPQTERPTIIKVHRDLFLHPFNDDIGTKILKEEWEKALKPILKNFNLLVVGYGGNDGSLMDYLSNIKAQERNAIYWCVRNKNELNDKITNLLDEKDFVVTIKGFDELMIALNEALEYKIFENLDDPDGHPFVTSAKQRISDLNEKRKSLLEKLKNEDNISEETKDIFTGAFKHIIDAYAASDNVKKDKIFKQGVKEYPNDIDLLGSYASFLDDNKQYDQAENYYKKAIKLEPNDAGNLCNYAVFLKNVRHNYKEAEKHYKKALELEPDHPDILGNYAVFLKSILKDFDKAGEYYEKAIESDPNHPNNLANYAEFLSNVRQDYDEAEEYYKKVFELTPNDPHVLGNYAHHILLSKQDYKEAEKFIDKAFSLSQQNETELLAELWFYRYAHYKKWLVKGEKELRKLISTGTKCLNWNFQGHIDIAERNNRPNIEKLKEFADLLGK